MKWVWLAIGALAGLVAIVAVVGAMLPQSHTATRSVRVRRTRQEVWAVLVGPPGWRSNIKASGVLAGNRFWEEDSSGERIEYEVVEERAPSHRVTRIATADLPYGGTWTYELQPIDGGGTLVRVREDGEVYNVFFRFVSRFVMGHTSGIEAYLKDLTAKLGEQGSIEP